MKRDDKLRTFFLIFIFLAFAIDNPFTNAFGGYEAFTGVLSNVFFQNISSWLRIPLPFSIYEWSLAILTIAVLRRKPNFNELPNGTFLATLLFWGYVVFWALVSVLFFKGSTQAIFWDFKGLITMPLVMIIFVKLFPTPQDLVKPAKVFIAAIVFKSAQALFLNFLIWETGHREQTGYLIDHAASFHISAVLLILVGSILFKWWRPHNVRQALGLAAVFGILLTSYVLNERRTEMVGFVLSLGIMGSFVAMRKPGKTLLAIPFVTLALGLYIALFANSKSILGKPIQLLTSLNNQDDLSKIYRLIENYNLFSTLSANPIFGQGFGRPMFDVAGLSAFLDSDFFLLHPHNSILGFWSQAGAFGLGLLMLFFAAFAYHALHNLFNTRDPLLLLIGTVALANLFRYEVFSVGDQLFLHSSSNFVLGASLGAIAILSSTHKHQNLRRTIPATDTTQSVQP